MNFTEKIWLESRAGGKTARQTGHHYIIIIITAWPEVPPVRDGDGDDPEYKAEDAHENQSSTQCCLPLPTAGAAARVGGPRGPWSAHPPAAAAGLRGGRGGGGGGGPHCYHIPLTSTQDRSENCSPVTIQLSTIISNVCWGTALGTTFPLSIPTITGTVTKISGPAFVWSISLVDNYQIHSG